MTELYKDMELVYKPSIDRLRDDMARVKDLAKEIVEICSKHDWPMPKTEGAYMRSDTHEGSTHWEGCEEVHHDCALALLGRHRGALKEVYSTIGPTVPCCLECEGCAYEMGLALEIIRNALGLPVPQKKNTGTAPEIGVQAKSHTDHPLRVWDRTCPACSIQEVYDRVDNDYERKGD